MDPHLLRNCTIEEFKNSYATFTKHFHDINLLLTHSKTENDLFWKQADKRIDYREVRGLCLGFARKGTAGSGIGPQLRQRILRNAKSIIDAGRQDPVIFELMGLFEDDIGPDRISDMAARIISEDIVRYSNRVFEPFKNDFKNRSVELDIKTDLPINPYNHHPILLIPCSIIRDLPIAYDWTSLDMIARENQEIRDRVNQTIGETWKQATDSSTKKQVLRECLFSNPDLIDDLVLQYKNKPSQTYDFSKDRAGERIWYEATRDLPDQFPLSLSQPKGQSTEWIEEIVIMICNHFKKLVEKNGLNKLFYNDDGTRKHESAIQLLFYGLSDAYCNANNIPLVRESNSGRGPLDFRFATSYDNSVIVEVKKSTNISGLERGVEKQLPMYMESDSAKKGIYLVIDMGFTQAAEKQFKKLLESTPIEFIKVIQVDGKQYPSASK